MPRTQNRQTATTRMPVRSWIKRLEKRANEGSSGFVTKDGRVIRYDPNKAGADIFVYMITLLTKDAEENPPPEPEVVRRIREEASDPVRVMKRFESGSPGKFISPLMLLDDYEDDPESPLRGSESVPDLSQGSPPDYRENHTDDPIEAGS
jgi:hypothetical protein